VSDVAPERELGFSANSEIEQLFVVLGYGCHLNAKVRGYLEHAAEEIKKHSPAASLVITTGGYTAHRSAPGVSEAAMMAAHLRTLGVIAPITIEEGARTTVENIRNVGRLIADRGWSPQRLVIFGDRARQKKIRALARHFFHPRAFAIDPYDLRRSLMHTLVQSTIAVPFDALVARVSWLERLSLAVVEWRQRSI
jgi:hypothetical protein